MITQRRRSSIPPDCHDDDFTALSLCDEADCSGPLIQQQTSFTPLLDLSDVCALFGRTERSIRRWVSAGHLTPIRVGGAIFFEASDIRVLIEKRLRH